MTFLRDVRNWARRIKTDAVALWFARSHPHTPWYAKALAIFVVAYALSPIDLIPDFIPVLGYVDDVILLPLLIWLAVQMLPADVLRESRQQAQKWLQQSEGKPRVIAGAVMILVVWVALAAGFAWWLKDYLAR